MKKLAIILGVALLSTTLFSQEKTLLGGELTNGGYGAIFTKVGQVTGATGVYMGGQGSWMINHRLGIGGKGYGIVNAVAVPELENIKWELGCWGGLLEYHFFPEKMVNLHINSMIGGGGVRYSVIDYQKPYDEEAIDWSDDGFFVFEPGIGADLHVHKNFRIGINVTYRMVNGVEYADLTNGDLSGLSAEFSLKFGAF